MGTKRQLARIFVVILALAGLMITTSQAIAQPASAGDAQVQLDAPLGSVAASAMPSSDPSRCRMERRRTARATKRLGKAARKLKQAERSGSPRSATVAERHVRQSKRHLRDQQARSNQACGFRLRTKLARGAVDVPATAIASVQGNPAQQQTVVLKPGANAPTVGGFLVVDATGSNAGVLGKVVAAKRLQSGGTRIRTQPATLDEAYSTFELAYSGSLADFGGPVSSGATATASALTVRFTCSGTGSTARSLNVDLSAIQVDTLLLADPQFPYFSLSVIGRPRFSLQFDANGSVACSAPLGKRCGAFGPVLLCFTPILKLSADGRINLRYDWQPRFSYELRRAGYTPSRNRDERTFESHGTPSLEGQANAQARLHLGLNASVGGVVGLVGALTPHVDGTASFRAPPPTACAKISAAINYGLTGYADVFVKRWEWDIAKGEFLHRTLFDRCTNSGDSESGNPDTDAGNHVPAPPDPPDAGGFTQISGGNGYRCGIRSGGALTCWGDDAFGQTSPPAGSFTQVSAGLGHGCAVRTSGEAACWGDDALGQASPPGGVFATVSAGSLHSCGLRAGGAVECWGHDDLGQSSPPPGAFAQVSAGNEYTCGLRPDGEAVCWGDDAVGQASPPAESLTQISSGGGTSCGLRADGSAICWGMNSFGITSPPLGAFSEVSVGGAHACGLRTDGTADCWGWDLNGQASAPGGTFTQISAGTEHTCGLRNTGVVLCWGGGTFE